MTEDRKTGTAEWAGSTRNWCMGCAHGCLYCYARARALRFGQIESGDAWTTERIYAARVAKGYRKAAKQPIMAPSAHDITWETFEAAATVLGKLAAAGNELLIVTKANLACVEQLAERLEPYKGQILWRLTIGCLDDRTRMFWEPNAPPIDERLSALAHLHDRGWATSVSCEPLLEPWNARKLVGLLLPHVSETIWIGMARDLRARTAWCKGRAFLAEAIETLEAWQTPRSAFYEVYEKLVEGEAIRWKDSYAEALAGFGVTIEDGKAVTR